MVKRTIEESSESSDGGEPSAKVSRRETATIEQMDNDAATTEQTERVESNSNDVSNEECYEPIRRRRKLPILEITTQENGCITGSVSVGEEYNPVSFGIIGEKYKLFFEDDDYAIIYFKRRLSEWPLSTSTASSSTPLYKCVRPLFKKFNIKTLSLWNLSDDHFAQLNKAFIGSGSKVENIEIVNNSTEQAAPSSNLLDLITNSGCYKSLFSIGANLPADIWINPQVQTMKSLAAFNSSNRPKITSERFLSLKLNERFLFDGHVHLSTLNNLFRDWFLCDRNIRMMVFYIWDHILEVFYHFNLINVPVLFQDENSLIYHVTREIWKSNRKFIETLEVRFTGHLGVGTHVLLTNDPACFHVQPQPVENVILPYRPCRLPL